MTDPTGKIRLSPINLARILRRGLLVIFVSSVVLSSNGAIAGEFDGWNSHVVSGGWDSNGALNGWNDAYPVTVLDHPRWHQPPPTYKVRTVTKVIKKVPKKVTHSYTTYEDDHEPWISLDVKGHVRKPTIVLNGWAKNGKFGLNVNIH